MPPPTMMIAATQWSASHAKCTSNEPATLEEQPRVDERATTAKKRFSHDRRADQARHRGAGDVGAEQAEHRDGAGGRW